MCIRDSSNTHSEMAVLVAPSYTCISGGSIQEILTSGIILVCAEETGANTPRAPAKMIRATTIEPLLMMLAPPSNG